MFIDMNQSSFRGLFTLVSVIGTSPQQAHEQMLSLTFLCILSILMPI